MAIPYQNLNSSSQITSSAHGWWLGRNDELQEDMDVSGSDH